MRVVKKAFLVLALLLTSTIALTSCTGGGGIEDEYAKVFSGINPDWALYEVVQQGESVVIAVEVSNTEKVPFKDAKKAVEALMKVNPKLQGYIEFKGKEVPMTLRRMELIPAG